MRYRAGKDHHHVGRTDLVPEICGELGEDFAFTAVLFAYFLVSAMHSVVAAYDYDAHFVPPSRNVCLCAAKIIGRCR